MILGIPKEGEVFKGIEEKRVGLTPVGVRELVDLGADIFVASNAGLGAGFRNEDYRSAGAKVVYSNEEVIRRGEVIVQVGRPSGNEWQFYNRGSALLSFLHLGAPSRELLQMLAEKRITAIGYEIVRENDNSLPILRASSEIAGKMAVQLAGHLLESTSRGRGVLLAGIPGIPPADVIILGGGTVGYYAARSFQGVGASVYILDVDLDRLRELDQLFQGQVVTAVASRSNIEKHVLFADVLITCAVNPGKLAPLLVTREMVTRMSAGSVVIDFSIDQGGCVETSRLRAGDQFLFQDQGVVHFCAPNVPAMVARTSSYALTNVLLPYLREIVGRGLQATLMRNHSLRQGLYTLNGRISKQLAVEGMEKADLEQVLNEMV
jgi:alanine dehydrogenase